MAKVTIGGRSYEVEVHGNTVVVDGHEIDVTVRDEGEHTLVTSGGVGYRVQLPDEAERGSGMGVQVDYRPFTFEFEGALTGGPTRGTAPARKAAAPRRAAAPAVKGAITAKLAGTVLKVNASVGDSVSQGQVVLVLEAMKMENEIKAGADGVVKELPVATGDKVADGAVLIVIE